MLVEIVTFPGNPAFSIISASSSWCLAFRIEWDIFCFFKIEEINSEFSTDVVPIKIGCFFSCLSLVDYQTF